MSTSLLAVDDEQGVLEIVRYAGEEAGCDVRLAGTAKQFMTSLQAQHPDVIVMDIIMPEMDGLELLAWLSKEGCHAPVILVSGYDEMYLTTAKEFASLQDQREIRTIRKPFRIDDLVEKIRELTG